ncbi:MAG: MotA/TolQ/ExbB proton channel family protein [Sphingobacteriales bacterium]|nr:MotA/TolQ/ExbB proton channel family protein [Sphingobacteriales bacterium]
MAQTTATTAPKKGGLENTFALLVIPVIIIVCILLYKFVMGSPSNFEGGDPNNHPLPGNYLGIVYKGGVIVPILMSFFLMVIVFSIERFITINRAYGSGSLDNFVRKVKSLVDGGRIDDAIAESNRQKGSVGNVVRSTLEKYKEVQNWSGHDKEQKIAAIQKQLEESTSLELPMLEKNLTIIATLASIATLTGLLGTVIGMIKAFAALAVAGNPDAVALANGISEALVNTALGIGTSTLAIIAYNYFTSRIDTLTYNLDEIGVSLTQSYNATH